MAETIETKGFIQRHSGRVGVIAGCVALVAGCSFVDQSSHDGLGEVDCGDEETIGLADFETAVFSGWHGDDHEVTIEVREEPEDVYSFEASVTEDGDGFNNFTASQPDTTGKSEIDFIVAHHGRVWNVDVDTNTVDDQVTVSGTSC
jgi:hypothetical protein